jgi:hypothetical protein
VIHRTSLPAKRIAMFLPGFHLQYLEFLHILYNCIVENQSAYYPIKYAGLFFYRTNTLRSYYHLHLHPYLHAEVGEGRQQDG